MPQLPGVWQRMDNLPSSRHSTGRGANPMAAAVPLLPAVSSVCSCAQGLLPSSDKGDQGLPSKQLLHCVCLPELQWTKLYVETSVPDLKSALHFLILGVLGIAEHVPPGSLC